MKYEYYIECYAWDRWIKIKTGSLQYCQGYLDARKDYSPRLHYQLMRSDGQRLKELQAKYDVSIGQIAGWPTAEQYDRAGNEALERAKAIRARQDGGIL